MDPSESIELLPYLCIYSIYIIYVYYLNLDKMNTISTTTVTRETRKVAENIINRTIDKALVGNSGASVSVYIIN